MKIIRDSSNFKKWIKNIPLDNEIKIQDFSLYKYFKKVAIVEIDDEINTKSNKKKRQTIIKFKPTISIKEYKDKTEWIYICD